MFLFDAANVALRSLHNTRMNEKSFIQTL